MGSRWLLFAIPVALLSIVQAGEEIYMESNGDVLRQLPPSLYRAGVIQFRNWTDPESHDQTYKMFQTEGWKTTFTIQKSEVMEDVFDISEIVYSDDLPPSYPALFEVTEGSTGRVFETSSSVKVEIRIKLGRYGRVRWISTPMDTSVQWGFVDHETFQNGIPWPFDEISSVMLNLVNNGSTSWMVEMNGTSVPLEEGRQLFSTANVSTIRLLNASAVDSDFLLEWFPYAEGNHIHYKSSGCLSYKDTEAPIDPHSWLLKNSTIPGILPEPALKVTFFNVSSHTDELLMNLLVGSEAYLVARHSIAFNSVYNIPVSGEHDVSLRLSTTGLSTLMLCYQPSIESDFSATGYMRSNGYPDVITWAHPNKVEGFPLPTDWSLTIKTEALAMGPNRAWLDLTLSDNGRSSTLVQSYTGTIEAKNPESLHHYYYRYPVTRHIWRNWYRDFGRKAGRYNTNELVAKFQSMQEVQGSRIRKYDGYSLKLEARIQTESDGKGTVYTVGDSGTIQSPSPYYHFVEREYYNVEVQDTTAYNAIQFTFGDSYTQTDKDALLFYDHVSFGKLVSTSFTISGNMTGRIFTYKSTNMTVMFSSDECKEYKGFTIDWKAVYVSNETTTNSTSTSMISTTTPILPDVTKEPSRLDDRAIGIIVGLSGVTLLLLILLIVAVVVIIKDRKKLSDLSVNTHTPRYTVSSENGKISD